MSKNTDFNQENRNQQFIIAGMAGLIDEGYSAREVFQILESIKNQTFHAFLDLQIEREGKK